MNKKIKNKKTQIVVPVEKKAKPKKKQAKKTAKKSKPSVKIVNFDFDINDPKMGSIELDWNKEFIALLKKNNYVGNSDEDIVEKWLTDVCKNIANEETFQNLENVRYIQRKELGGGKTEFS